jgi:hypothetical protein
MTCVSIHGRGLAAKMIALRGARRAIASAFARPAQRAIGSATFRSSAVDPINTHPTIESVREERC